MSVMLYPCNVCVVLLMGPFVLCVAGLFLCLHYQVHYHHKLQVTILYKSTGVYNVNRVIVFILTLFNRHFLASSSSTIVHSRLSVFL